MSIEGKPMEETLSCPACGARNHRDDGGCAGCGLVNDEPIPDDMAIIYREFKRAIPQLPRERFLTQADFRFELGSTVNAVSRLVNQAMAEMSRDQTCMLLNELISVHQATLGQVMPSIETLRAKSARITSGGPES